MPSRAGTHESTITKHAYPNTRAMFLLLAQNKIGEDEISHKLISASTLFVLSHSPHLHRHVCPFTIKIGTIETLE